MPELRFPAAPLVRARLRALSAARLAITLCLSGCGAQTATVDARQKATPGPEPTGLAAAPPLPLSPAPQPAEPEPTACGEGMSLVAGNYCLTPEHRCLAHQDIPSEDGKIIPNQCTRYQEPVTCFADRRQPMRYCMDRYEWPNKKGELPRTLISYQHAKTTCEAEGKRLCTEEEFNFACEGEEMRPYVYGFSRDATKCNFDRPYRARTFPFTELDTCMADPACRAAYEAIDQRLPAGSMESCKSSDGVYDLNGNANEWVHLPKGKSPHRSGLKGGWWGPIRARCRPTVTFHDEGDFGYEAGFRCCSDAKP
jgi:sulfatase-modifying factor enzyme 1